MAYVSLKFTLPLAEALPDGSLQLGCSKHSDDVGIADIEDILVFLNEDRLCSMFLIEFNACARNIITNINSPTVMTFSSGEKKFKYVKNVIILWYFGYKPLSNDKYIQKWAFQYAAFLTAFSLALTFSL